MAIRYRIYDAEEDRWLCGSRDSNPFQWEWYWSEETLDVDGDDRENGYFKASYCSDLLELISRYVKNVNDDDRLITSGSLSNDMMRLERMNFADILNLMSTFGLVFEETVYGATMVRFKEDLSRYWFITTDGPEGSVCVDLLVRKDEFTV